MLYFYNLNFRKVLPVAFCPTLPGFRMILENDLLPLATLAQHLCFYCGERDMWHANLHVRAIYVEQHFVEQKLLTGFDLKPFNFQFLPGGNFILFATGFYDCETVHNQLTFMIAAKPINSKAASNRVSDARNLPQNRSR